MKVRTVDTCISDCNGFKVKSHFINLIHRDICIGVYLTVLKDSCVVSARVSGSDHFLLSAVHFTKDFFPSRKALYEYILTLAKTYGEI